jgi:diguanylate cyclase (GGDEF)-like protein
LQLERAFRRRGEGPNRTALWRNRFTAGAFALGIACGFASLAVFDRVHPYVQMVGVAGVMVIIIGGAARNAGCPTAATGQIVAGLLPTFVACAWIHDQYHLAFCLVILFETFAAFALMRRLNGQLVRLLLLDDEKVALVAEIRRANADLSAAAMTDSLTGIANRRRFDAVLRDEAGRARRERSDLALFILDIDSFKAYNDIYGHQAGDECLSLIAREFTAALKRPGDLGARYGGEEFVAVLARTPASDAGALAEAIRARVAALGIEHVAGLSGIVTVSIGVAGFEADHPNQRPESLVRAADIALYAAKDAGRNCVRVAPLRLGSGTAA